MATGVCPRTAEPAPESVPERAEIRRDQQPRRLFAPGTTADLDAYYEKSAEDETVADSSMDADQGNGQGLLPNDLFCVQLQGILEEVVILHLLPIGRLVYLEPIHKRDSQI